MHDTTGASQEARAFRAMAEAQDASIAFIDREYRVVAANTRRLEELGLGDREARGAALSGLLAPEAFERAAPLLERCLQGESVAWTETALDGEGEVDVRLEPAGDGAGGISGIVEVRAVHPGKSDLERRLEDREREVEALETELRRLSTIDSLSGSLNRGAILAALEEEIRRSARYDRPLALVLFDLDHFKLVNDIHGRAAGDDTIRAFSSICRSTFRNTDYIGRYGGEEFLAVLPEVGQTGALEAAERVRVSLQARRFRGASVASPWGDGATGEEFTVTASAGVASWERGTDSDRLLANVDAALYRAKEKGRNRVESGFRH